MRLRKKPLVVLLGWWNSHPKHLKKYSELYKSLGLETVEYIAPPHVIFMGPYFQHLAAKKVMNKVEARLESRSNKEVVFHSFSNNGGIMFLACHNLLGTNKYNAEYVGSIFDSCPGSIHPGLVYSTMVEAYPEHPQKGLIQFFGISILSLFVLQTLKKKMLLQALIVLASYKAGTFLLTLLYHKAMSMVKSQAPQLYLYSEEDNLVSHHAVNKVAANASERGILVSKEKFEGSKHVAHFRMHPKQYEEAIRKFVESL
mmetsp:Transcript_11437/g.13111  ORF Transcript_11437/g.13111 Transcript_11437/m.13111 type:complete len:257 (+) Transcript_11437:101-871(+)